MLLEALHRWPPAWRAAVAPRAAASALRRCRTVAPRLSLAVLLLACAASAAVADEIDRQAMTRRPTVTWTLAEREFGFAHWDQL
jgi:hypothetical protein